MTTPEELQTQLAKLRKIRAEGARVVEFRTGDTSRRVEFRDDAELQRAIADLEAQLAAANGRPPVKLVYITSSKGLR